MAELLDPKSPTRKELSLFLRDQRLIRAFEELFKLVPSEFNAQKTLIQETLVDSGIVDVKATQTLDDLIGIRRRLASTEVLTWLSM